MLSFRPVSKVVAVSSLFISSAHCSPAHCSSEPTLFISNRKIVGDNGYVKVFDPKIIGAQRRRVEFNLKDPQAGNNIGFFSKECNANDDPAAAVEMDFRTFYNKLRPAEGPAPELLLYVHGYNSSPVEALKNANDLQLAFNKNAALKERGKTVVVVPFIWPSEAETSKYYTDQDKAACSAIALKRAVVYFQNADMQKREKDLQNRKGQSLPIHVLAHSMGNRVFAKATTELAGEDGKIDPFFKHIFLFAADIVNEGLEPNKIGGFIPKSCKSLTVFYAYDDVALSGSVIANPLKFSYRLGTFGVEDLSRIPSKNVTQVDCGSCNQKIDPFFGHTYFVDPAAFNGGMPFDKMADIIAK